MRSAIGRSALGKFVPVRGVEGQPVAFLTAVTMLFVAGFKHFPAVTAAPAHLRPLFFGSNRFAARQAAWYLAILSLFAAL
jgi:hypothetical protein